MKKKLLIFGFALFWGIANAQDGTVDTNFNCGTGIGSSVVDCFVEQPDQNILITGNFNTYNGTPVSPIIRVAQTGLLDGSFTANTLANGPTITSIFDAVLQPDNTIILAGGWPSPVSPHLSRIDAAGNVDPSFNTGTGPNAVVYDIARQTNGSIVIGGTFTAYDGNAINRLARVTATGAFDPTFAIGGAPNTGPNDVVSTIAVQTDGRIIVGGTFTAFDGSPANRIVRLLPNGDIDPDFVSGSGFDATVRDIIIQDDGQILVHGFFSTYNGTPYNRIIRLNTDGSIDFSFPSPVISVTSSYIFGMILQQDQKILVTGRFTSLNGAAFTHIGRLLPDGTPDCTFHNLSYAPAIPSSLGECGVLPFSNKIAIFGGAFTSIDGIAVNDIVLLSGDAVTAIDDEYTFSAGSANLISDILADDSVYGAVATTSNATVTLISPPITGITFNPNATISVSSTLAVGNYVLKYSICASGAPCGDCDEAEVIINIVNPVTIVANIDDFTATCLNGVAGANSPSITANDTMNGLPINSSLVTVTLTSTGGLEGLTVNSAGVITIPPLTPIGTYIIYYTVTETANPLNTASSTATLCISNGLNPGTGPNNPVYDIARQSDGKIIIVGAFTKYNNITRNRIARLNTDLSLDMTFDANGVGFNDIVRSVAINSIGQIIVGGDFTATSTGVSARQMARLQQTANPITNGTHDPTFYNNNFYVYPGTNADHPKIESLAIDANNNIFAAGVFHKVNAQNKRHYAKFSSSGVHSTLFANNLYANGGFISEIKLYNSRIYIGGRFPILSNSGYRQIAKLKMDGTADTSFTYGNLSGTGLPCATSFAFNGSKMYVAGQFGAYNGTSIRCLAMVNSGTGVLASSGSFNPGTSTGTGTDQIIREIELTAANNLVIVGDFKTYNGASRNRIAGVLANGAINGGFVPGSGAGWWSVFTALIQPDGKIVIGGSFLTYNGLTAHYLTRVLGTNPAVMGRENMFDDDTEVSDKQMSFRMYPNPTTGIVNMGLDDFPEENFDFVLYNNIGQKVFEAGNISSKNSVMDISGLQAGNYYIILSNEKRVLNKIIVKQ